MTAQIPQGVITDSGSEIVVQIKSIFQELEDIRWQQAILEARRRELEPLVIEESLRVLNAKKSRNNKHTVYRSNRSDMIIQFRKEEPKAEDNQELETLQLLIEIESSKAQEANAEAIKHVKQQIAQLEAILAGMMHTDEGRGYLQEFDDLKESLTTKKPVIVVKLK